MPLIWNMLGVRLMPQKKVSGAMQSVPQPTNLPLTSRDVFLINDLRDGAIRPKEGQSGTEAQLNLLK